MRKDCVELIGTANDLGFYCNLITSALPLTEKKSKSVKKPESNIYK